MRRGKSKEECGERSTKDRKRIKRPDEAENPVILEVALLRKEITQLREEVTAVRTENLELKKSYEKSKVVTSLSPINYIP
jgi:hypothetical protein